MKEKKQDGNSQYAEFDVLKIPVHKEWCHIYVIHFLYTAYGKGM